MALPSPFSRDEITEETPLRLDVAARLAFPDGTIGASGLRSEASKGRLAITRIANRDYTTLLAIREMIEKCRVPQKERASGCGQREKPRTDASRTPPRGSSSTAAGNIPLASALQIVDALSKPSPATSPPSTNRRGATVTSLPSPSRT